MAASEPRQTQTMQPEADEKWVCLQDGGDGVNEPLLKDKDGDTSGEKKSLPNEAKGKGSARDTESFLWWFRSAWNEAHILNVLRHGIRPYVLGAALCAISVLHFLGALASLTESDSLKALVSCLKHLTMAVLCPVIFSIVTRFLTGAAITASTVNKSGVADLLFWLLVTNAATLLAACYTSIYEVGAGIMVYQEARREENFAWHRQLLADIVRVQAFTGAVVLAVSLVILMAMDVKTTFRATSLHIQAIKLYRQLAAEGRLSPLIVLDDCPYSRFPFKARTVLIFVTILAYILTLVEEGARGLNALPSNVTSRTSTVI
uniref:Uncharacterized protein n=1 Tax=Rhipicephalus appendiculatus TaxID=34631 RepID=A0A131YBN1_RHIAP